MARFKTEAVAYESECLDCGERSGTLGAGDVRLWKKSHNAQYHSKSKGSD